MRKHIVKTLLTFMLFLSWHNVNAACDYNEQAALNTKAASIKAVYEEKSKILIQEEPFCNEKEFESCEYTYNYFTVTILNMSPEFYIEIKNNRDKTKYTFGYEDVKNDVITFDWENFENVTTFTIDVYSSYETNCAREKIRTFYLTTPRFNIYSTYSYCNTYPEYYLCQKYVTFADIEFKEFVNIMKKHEESILQEKPSVENPNFLEKIWSFIKDNDVWIIGGATILVVGGVVLYVVVKRKRSVL